MQRVWQVALSAAILLGAVDTQAQTRFAAMDRNNDGVITRDEWRGNDRSFRNQDWNGDGVLSGDEVRPGARRSTWNQDWNRDGRVDSVDAQIAQRFRGYDVNNDLRVDIGEWHGQRRLFDRLDTSGDGYLTIQEYTRNNGYTLDALGGPLTQFSALDVNRDGWITRSEWRLGNAAFDRFDANNDNRINRGEYDSYTDADDEGLRDDRVGRTGAFKRGYERGAEEGRAAGREDYIRNDRWDLDGQRELEQADSGYLPQMGALSDYQAGYREGFRSAYREGYEAARRGQ